MKRRIKLTNLPKKHRKRAIRQDRRKDKQYIKQKLGDLLTSSS